MQQVLVIEDDDAFFSRFTEKVAGSLDDLAAFERVASGEEARAAMGSLAPDLVLCDLGLPPAPGEPQDDAEGERLIAWIEERKPAPPVVVLSGQDLARAVQLVSRRKVRDFISKTAGWKEIETRLRCVLRDIGRVLLDEEDGEGVRLAGGGASMHEARRLLDRARDSDATVLLLGETGTGKTLAARWLHEHSARRQGPFVQVACGALPADLVEAELFGHSAGAFTGAKDARRGRFRSADGGTLFLDELGEIPLSTQAKLLKVLEEKQVEPLGSDRSVAVDVRLVAATHRDLPSMVAEGQFREDLFYRLRVVTIVMPPLAERLEDLEDLVAHFLEDLRPRKQGLTDDAWAYLRSRPWKGNVRELRHTLEAAAVHAPGEVITAVSLQLGLGPFRDRGDEAGGMPDSSALLDTPGFSLRDWLADRESELVDAAMARAGGRAAEAARLLGEKPDTLRARLRRSKR